VDDGDRIVRLHRDTANGRWRARLDGETEIEGWGDTIADALDGLIDEIEMAEEADDVEDDDAATDGQPGL